MITVSAKDLSSNLSLYDDLFSNIRMKDSQPKLPKHNFVYVDHQNEFNTILFAALKNNKTICILLENEAAQGIKDLGWKTDAITTGTVYFLVGPDGQDIVDWQKTMREVVTFYFVFPNMSCSNLIVPFVQARTSHVKPRPEEDF